MIKLKIITIYYNTSYVNVLPLPLLFSLSKYFIVFSLFQQEKALYSFSLA
jgi:hypothetical protein